MEAITQTDLQGMVDDALLREIADTVGRRLAHEYCSQIQGVTSVLSSEGVHLRIRAGGPFRDIRMQFVEDHTPVRALFDDVNDDEL